MLRTLFAAALVAPLVLALVAPRTAWAGEGDDAAEAGSDWIADFDAAVEIAKQQDKDLFVDFTGSDWCHWCRKLDAEVLSQEEFLSRAKEDYVLVKLDYPRGEEAKAAVPNPERNEAVRQEHDVRGFPTVLLMTADGTVYGRTGYRPDGAASYVEHVEEMRSKGRPAVIRANDIAERYAAAEGEARMPVIEEAVAALGGMEPGDLGAETLAEPVRAALLVESEDPGSLRGRALKALLATGQGDAALADTAATWDPKNEAGLLEASVEARFFLVDGPAKAQDAIARLKELDKLGIRKKERAFRLYANTAWWSFQGINDKVEAAPYARKAKALGVGDPRVVEAMEKIIAEAEKAEQPAEDAGDGEPSIDEGDEGDGDEAPAGDDPDSDR